VIADLHRRRPLSAADLAALIDARETDLTPEPFDDEAAFLAYAEATSAPLVRLALAVLNAPMAHDRSVGLGYAITGLVRAAPYWARERRLALPRDLLAAEALTAEDVYRRRQRPVLAKVVAQLADRARLALDEVGRPDRAALPALLPAALARLHLARLARAGHDPFTLAERPPPALATPLRLIWAKWTGRL
jgi:phytoene synthase